MGKDNEVGMGSTGNNAQEWSSTYPYGSASRCQKHTEPFRNIALEMKSTSNEDVLEDGEVYISEDHNEEYSLSWVKVALALIPLATPSAVSIALTFGLAVIPLAFIGSVLGDKALTGASVGYFIISIVAQYPLCGLTFAMDAFCSQAYGRDPESDEQGVILQRGVLVGIVFVVPVNILLLLCQQILPTIYGEEIGAVACDFMKFGFLFIIPLVTFTAFSKFCLNQLKPQLPMTALIVGIIVTPLTQYLLVKRGVHGSMLGMVLSAWTQLLVIVCLTLWVEPTRRTFGKIRIREVLDWDELKEYILLALPSSLFVAAEASAFDVAVLLAATLGTAEGAAFSATLNCLLIFVSLAGGMSTAACAKIGASLGAQLPRCAWQHVVVAVACALAVSSLNGIIMFVLFDPILSLFGVGEASLAAAHTVRWVVPLTHVADSAQYVFQGVFSGMGHNKDGARILITCLWAIGFPLELLFTYAFGWGISGILGGLTIGLLLESPAMLWYVRNVDWEQLAKEASGYSECVQLEEDPRVMDLENL
ncbi:multidrug resistance protein, MATE family [Trypanosoma grayi]|uniref:multidrug resistance protein, MATE family n=1 Tax=Trypanosoma grayi TaxID=71804 RepID=UPI0004F3F653|nr:multidrug resistance protein, MATE family [Trypanosoma grayi]KEG09431.1 multidrug resistance protein, MATE family [Trypanosoma grayi]